MPRGLCTKNSFLKTAKSVPCSTMTFCCSSVKKCKNDCLNFGNKVTGCCIVPLQSVTLPCSVGQFWSKTTRLWLPSTLLAWLAPCSIPQIENKVERSSAWHDWHGWSRNAVSAEHSPRTWLPWLIWKIAKSLGLVSMCKRRILLSQWYCPFSVGRIRMWGLELREQRTLRSRGVRLLL